MPVYIRSSGGDILVFDAVTSYKQDYNSKVTEHPLESGANVTDHIIKENLKITVSGVFSDYSPSRTDVVPNLVINGQSVSETNVKNRRNAQPVYVKASTQQDNAVGSNYSIVPRSSVAVNSAVVKEILIKMQRSGEVVTLFELEGATIKKNGYFPDVIITGLSFSEEEDSGEALYVAMQCTVVRFANTKTVAITSKTVKAAATDQATGDAPSGSDVSKKDLSVLEVLVNTTKTPVNELFE